MIQLIKLSKLALLSLVLCLLTSVSLMAQQQIQVTGRVTNNEAVAIPDITVRNLQSNAVASTNANGEFTIEAKINDKLQFTGVGFETQTSTVSSSGIVNIQLASKDEEIDEVVVVGFGQQKKVNLTGAVATVGGDELTKRPVTDAGSMLQGKMPGVRVVQNSGQPGEEGLSIRVRGQGTFSGAGSNPLVLIDGVEGRLSDINPNDIENVSVLKDAASASIYGSRAANGVIIVTTKSGIAGKTKVDYQLGLNVHDVTRLPEFITNSAEYMELWNEAKTNSNMPSGLYPQDIIDAYKNATDRNQYPNTDWVDVMFNPAFVQNHYLTFNGGEGKTKYNVSLGYVDQPGTMKGFDFQRYNFRSNITSDINDFITFGTNLSFKHGVRNSPRSGGSDIFLSTLAQAPTYGPYLPDGSGRYSYKAYLFESNNKNPVAIAENGVFNRLRDYSGNLQAWTNVKLLKGLSWYSKFAVNGDFYRNKDWRPVVPLYNFHTGEYMTNLDVGDKGLTNRSEQRIYTNLYSYLLYETSFSEKHNLKLQLGYSQENSKFENLTGYREQFLNNDLQELNAGSAAVQTAGGYTEEWAIQSLFGRVGYDYLNRYLLEMNVRYDGTSRLNPDNRWGAFPSISAGWRISDEPFIKANNWNWLNDFKLRASYGILGNQNIGLYPYQSILELTGAYSYDNATLIPGVAQLSLANQNIKWETTKSTDVGVDLAIFNGLTITADWYRKVTSDILRQSQLTDLVGLSAPYVNRGVMENSGIELNVTYRNTVKSGAMEGLAYDFGVMFDKFKNKLVTFGAEEISGYYMKREGLPYDSFYMLEMDGIFQSQAEIDNAPKQFNDKTLPGDIKYKDQNNDNKIDNSDRIIIGNPFPKFEYSFNLGASWKGIDISAFFQGVYKRDVYVNNWGTIPFVQGAVPTVDWRDRWTEANPSKTMPRIYWGWDGGEKITRNSSYYLKDASFLRFKNLVVGYTFPESVTSKLKLNKVRAYFSGDNLFTITDYPGLDPERGGSGNFLSYPQNKIYSFGLQLSL